MRRPESPRGCRHRTPSGLAVLPFAVFVTFGDPVGLLTLAGAIEAVHIPPVTALVVAWCGSGQVDVQEALPAQDGGHGELQQGHGDQ